MVALIALNVKMGNSGYRAAGDDSPWLINYPLSSIKLFCFEWLPFEHWSCTSFERKFSWRGGERHVIY